jgi:hypothetical protein
MPPVRLWHPVHGVKYAYMQAEIEADLRHGWKVADVPREILHLPVKHGDRGQSHQRRTP